ncbi:helicase with zinc finger domain 2-like isoform X1 [Conger conger]|uniref:helicase with zinc finger domain 2-like isoform X1 n=1 Tax=Conger conger TaxID=82655 RepID=UPI002A5A6073|nr:helicase with zinc finger domain 2-like isoform X1 [Conger conger]
MSDTGHGEQSSVLSPLLQTHELCVACASCCEQPHDIHLSHRCGENILLARQRGGRETDWKHVSPRPTFRNPAKYVKCLFTAESGECLQYGKRCTFAKSDEEATVWNFLKNSRLEHSLLIGLVSQAQGREEEKEELDVAERIQSLFTGHFLQLCHACFHSSPRQITPERPAKACGHPLHPALVLFQVGGCQGEKIQFSEIRPIPLGLRFLQFRHCWHVQRGHPCRTACTFPHSEAEMAVWTAERNEGLDRNDLVTALDESDAQESAEEPQAQFHCTLCQLQFYSQDGFVSHCSSLAHERRYCEDEDPVTEWKHRCPPECSQAFELCNRPDTCEYRENCTAAHSIEELQEWCLRMRMVRRKRKAAQEQGLLSYRDQLLMEYRESINEVLIMSEDVEGVTVTCDKELHLSSEKKKLEVKWTFTIHSERPLKAAALLKQEPGAAFTLGDSTSKCPCAYSDGSLFCTLGTSYTLPVTFSSDCPGRYEQWLALDFDTRPVLLQKIQVHVGERQIFPELAEDMSQSGSPAPTAPLPSPLRTEPWHRGNRIIVTCLHRTEAAEELLKEYKPPWLNPTFSPATVISDVTLTRKNYRESMHSFLYREELAQDEVLSRLSLQSVVVTLSDTITRSPFEMKAVPFPLLYASVPLSYTPQTPEGQLLRTAVGSALVAPSPSAGKKVYEARVLLEASTEDTIYLLLSRACCSELSLRKEESCPMDIQFQLNRLEFCEWHQAVDLLPDVERVLPELNRRSIPDYSGEFPKLKLNVKQRAAMSLIIGEASEQTPTAPVLIYGPFGTGKTFTLATAIKELLRQPCTRVLICTHTNSSADLYVKDHFHHYVEGGHPEARPLRIKANKKGLAILSTDKITLGYCLVAPDNDSFLFPKRSDLDSHRLVITTASMARHLHDLKLPVGYFTHILIDEASQMLECAALIPLTLAGSRTKVVLTGDHMQTGPKLFSVAEGRSSSDYTLLNRLFHYYQGQKGEAASRSKVIFSENYRCTKVIVDFIATHFYFGKLDVRTNEVIKASGRVPSHPRFHPLRFHHIRGTCSWDKVSMSWYNAEEAKGVAEIVEELLKEWPPEWGKQEQQAICVLSQEYGQIKLIRRELRKKKMGNVIVETVYNVQGKQFRAILMTAVHTRDSLLLSDSAHPELFEDTRVLNTAMTRAQSQVVAVGDAPALCYFGRCSKIWKCYINECIDKGSANPKHITINHIKQEVKEISKFHKTGEGYNSDIESSESEVSRIEDSILQELLDEGKDVQVGITEEGLLEIIQKALSGETTVAEDWSDTNIELLLRTRPNDFKRCKLIMEKFDSGYAIPLDQATLRISITGRDNIGRSFPGDVVAVEILRDDDISWNGKVVGVLKGQSQTIFVCAIDMYDPQVMTPINKCAPKIFAPFVKGKPNYVAVRKKENGHWFPHKYVQINEDLRQNCLFVVEVLKWVKPCRYPLGVVTKVLQKTGSEEDGLEMLDIEYQLLKGPPKCNERDFKVCLKNKKDREEFRNYTYTFTIDSIKSQDLDDAISVRDLGAHYEIGVHITDVASFVAKGSEVDKYAETQGNVLYRVNEDPAFLFPEALRQDHLSLLPECERHAISLMVVIEKESNRIMSNTFALSLIKSKKRMTYQEADKILQRHYVNSGVPLRFDTWEDCLAVVYHFSKVHKYHRVSGNVRHVQSDEGGKGKGMSHDMVAELMIMYNSFVSDLLIDNEETKSLTPLRCQDCPDPKEVSQLLARHSALMPFSAHLSHLQNENMDLDNDNAKGQSADEQILKCEEDKVDSETTEQCHARDSFTEFNIFTSLFKQFEAAAQNRDFHMLVYLITADDIHPQLQPIAVKFSSLLQKNYIHRSKSTSQSKVGHHDLLLDSYTWASSPMRRYMDVIVQRLLHSALENTTPRYTSKEIDLFCALYMEKCKRKAEFDNAVQNLNTTIYLSQQSAQIMAVVNDLHSRRHFQVSFLINQGIPSQMSIQFKDLKLIDQPEFMESDGEIHSIILKWKRRVYSFTNSHISSKLKGVKLNCHITPVQANTWESIVSAIRAEDWEKVVYYVREIKPSLSRCLKEGECRPPEFQHYTELSLELKVGQSLPVQLGTDINRGRTFPAVQLLNIHPQFDICLQHSKNPVMCFSNLALKASKQVYSSYREYMQIWGPMCAVDTAHNAVAENDSIVLEGVKITWKDETNGYFYLSLEQKKQWSIECDLKNCFLCIRLRDQMVNGCEGMDFYGISPLLNLEDPQSFTWVAHGVTTKEDEASRRRLCIQIDFSLNHLSMKNTLVFSENTVFTVELIPKNLPCVLREHAIANLVRANELVKNISMGKTPFHTSAVFENNAQNVDISDGQLPSLSALNESQKAAIKKALEMPFSLIQGPPGTGKTVVGIHIVYWFFTRNQKADATGHYTHNKKGLEKKNGILYCGPSNKSVDIVAEQLLKLKDVKALRVCSDQMEMLEFPYPGSRMKVCRKSLREEKPDEALRSITLRYLIRKTDNPFSHEILSFESRIEEEGTIDDDEIASYRKLLNKARQYELRKHDVVLCTCAAAQDPNLLKTMNFRQILIDECSMATEPEALIPLVAHKPEQIVLLGDHKQIQPIVQCNLVKTLGMKKSLFERYQTESYGHLATMLDTQYRMHEDICKFPSETFYNGCLVTKAKRETSVLLSPSKKPTAILFGQVDGKEETLVVSTEKGNENSTMNVEESKQAEASGAMLSCPQSGPVPAQRLTDRFQGPPKHGCQSSWASSQIPTRLTWPSPGLRMASVS